MWVNFKFIAGTVRVDISPELVHDFAELLSKGVVSDERAFDALQQVEYFQKNADRITKEYQSQHVVICGSQPFAGKSSNEALEACREKFPNRPAYTPHPSHFLGVQ